MLNVDQPDAGLQAGAGRRRGEETNPVDAVVRRIAESRDPEVGAVREVGEQAQGEHAVGDRPSEGTLAARPLDIDVDPVVVSREFGERVDHRLLHFKGVAPGAELLADLAAEGVDVVEADRPHGSSPAADCEAAVLLPTQNGLDQA